MPKRCARCGAIRRIRERAVPADWLAYLTDERDVSPPVGTLKMPLCPDCYREAEDLVDDTGDDEAVTEFLDAIDPATLVDEQT